MAADQDASAAEAWRVALLGWAIPPAILDAAPADPYAFPPGLISTPTVDPLRTPTGRRVVEVLEPGEAIIDVGCGAGRISGAFAPAHPVVGVEPRERLASVAREVGIAVHVGRWPEAAEEVGSAPVVLCTHVLYDVADPAPFIVALTRAGGRRVVLEVTATHPWAWITPLYRRFHDLDRPDGPSATMLAAVVEEVGGVQPSTEMWTRPRHRYADLADLVAHARQMLCLDHGADQAIAQALEAGLAGELRHHDDGTVSLPDQELVTLWWDVDGRRW